MSKGLYENYFFIFETDQIIQRSVKLCSATEEMIKTGMKELDVDGVSAQLQQSLYSASDMLGEFTKKLKIL